MKKLLIAIVTLLCVGFAHAEVELDGGYIVEASFVSTAPVQVVWDVLTDYNNIDKFVSVITKSEMRDGVLYQTARGNWWFFRKSIDLELQITETLYNKIAFESIKTDGSFSIYQGAWTIKHNGVVSISYTLIAKPNFFVPKGIIRSVLRKQTDRYINQVEIEINRRVHGRE